QKLIDWKDRSFTATGTSVSSEKVFVLRPAEMGPRWSGVSDDARNKAVTAARQDAAQHLLDTMRPIEVAPGHTMNDAVLREPVQQAVVGWVTTRPVTQLRYDDNLEVELTVSTPPDELFQTVVDSARTVPGTSVPSDEKSLDQLKQEFEKRISTTT